MMAGLTVAESRALTIHRSTLLSRLEPDDVVDYLYSYEMLNQQQFEDIKSLTTRHRKCEALLSILQRALPVHYALFVRVLQKTQQGHLATLLLPSASLYGPAAPAKATAAKGGPASSSAGHASVSGRLGEELSPPPPDCLDFDRSPTILDVVVRPCTDSRVLALLGGRGAERLPSSYSAAAAAAVYRMTQPTRGRALVLCNTSFAPGSKLAPRPSADNDATNVSSLLQRLGFDVQLLRNATRAELQGAIDAERRYPAHAWHGAFVLYLSSHGEDGAVYGTDGQRLLLDDVYDALDGHACPQLAGKPKLIVVESSQGPLLDRGVAPTDEAAAAVAYPSVDLQLKQFSIPSSAAAATAAASGGSGDGGVGRARGRLPAKADFIVALSAFFGYASLRHAERGCWFSRALVEAFAEHACDEHVTQLLRRVRRMVLQAETDLGYKQVSMTHDTLLKDFYLFPGVADPLPASS